MPAKGFKTTLGYGEESTYGTPVASSKWNEILSESLKLTDEPIIKPSMRGATQRGFFQSIKTVGGSVEIEAMYEGMLKLLKHALGSVAAVEPEAATRWTHTFTRVANTALPTGLTFELGRDLQGWRYHGCKINELTLSQEVADTLKLALGILGEDEEKVTAGAATYPTERLIPFHQGILKIATVATDAQGFEVTLNNGLTAERHKFGGRLTKEPAANDFRTVTGSISKDFETADIAALYDKWVAGTEVAIQLDYTGPVLGAGNYKFTIDMPRCVLMGDVPTVSGPGLVPLTIPYQAIYDETGAADAFKVTVVNGESAA